MKQIIHDVLTDIYTEREMTPDEQAEHLALLEEMSQPLKETIKE